MNDDSAFAALLRDLTAFYEVNDRNRFEAMKLLAAGRGKWLRDGRFQELCIHEDKYDTWINWRAAAELSFNHPASGGELRILRLACSIAGFTYFDPVDDQMTRWSLDEQFNGLDPDNRALALGAIHRAFGHSEY